MWMKSPPTCVVRSAAMGAAGVIEAPEAHFLERYDQGQV
jgi:hypothetical protein